MTYSDRRPHRTALREAAARRCLRSSIVDEVRQLAADEADVEEIRVEAYDNSGVTAAELLYRERLLHEVERSHEWTLVHDVLFGDADAPRPRCRPARRAKAC